LSSDDITRFCYFYAMFTVLLLGANSDVAKAAILQYAAKGYHIIAASRSTNALRTFTQQHNINATILYFDAADISSHEAFYASLPTKPNILVYAAGYLVSNEAAFKDFKGAFQMMQVHYAGAVSIINIMITDPQGNLERIIGLSSLSGVRGRKSNFIYGSTKSAFTQYLAGLRQYLSPRHIKVNVIVAGYIRSKMTAGLNLPENLMLEPEYIAAAVVNAGNQFTIVPGFRWKAIYWILKMLPERLVAKLP
jgi:decaprenylphospho-beta-D-erythro-pentofuranosid-2-ulose 2-reductase